MTVRRTRRWTSVTAVTFAAVAVGVLTNQPAALLAGTAGVAFAAYAARSDAPTPDLHLERSVSTTTPDPGEDVTVTVTLRNDGGFLPDLRVVDGVPDALDVVDGTPRHATALRAGKTAEFSYTVEAARGEHDFTPTTLIARDTSGALERELAEPIDTTLRCVPQLPDVGAFPLRGTTMQRVGSVPTDSAGSGIEFQSVREYRPGDPLSRVDWKRLARSGDLTTVEYRQERAASVVVLVDSRDAAHVDGPTGTPQLDHAVQAASGVVAARLDQGDRVGVAAFGPHWEWTPPGLGRDHRERVRRSLALDDGYSVAPPDRRFLAGFVFRRLRKNLPGDAQVVCCTPLLDDHVVHYLRQLEATGHPVTVVSPDVTRGDTAGEQLARVERDVRIRKLRRAGIRVADWRVTESLPVAIAAARRGWRQ